MRQKKISGSTGPDNSLKAGKFSLAQAIVLTRKLFLKCRISLDYFYHPQVFVYTRADKN